MDPEFLPGSGTQKIQSWIRIHNTASISYLAKYWKVVLSPPVMFRIRISPYPHGRKLYIFPIEVKVPPSHKLKCLLPGEPEPRFCLEPEPEPFFWSGSYSYSSVNILFLRDL